MRVIQILQRVQAERSKEDIILMNIIFKVMLGTGIVSSKCAYLPFLFSFSTPTYIRDIAGIGPKKIS
jgi:hypothetical protein